MSNPSNRPAPPPPQSSPVRGSPATGSGEPYGGKAYLPTDAAERKGLPICTGFLDYFPLAAAEVAKISKAGNDQHNGVGSPLHWARGKSMDQADTMIRHIMERGGIDPIDGLRHSAKLAWRAMANLQIEMEEVLGLPISRGSSES